MLKLLTLGALRLTGGEGELLGGRRKELALLVIVARGSPRPVRRAELMAMLWGERDESRARHALRQTLWRVKQALGAALDVEGDDVSLKPGTVELDVAAFEADLAAGRLADAVERWGGDFFPEAETTGAPELVPWVEGEREGLRKRLAGALERLTADAGARGAHAEAVMWAERWASALPYDERAHLRLVDALALAGRRDDARARYAAFVARLERELGIPPSPELRQLGSRLDSPVVGPRPRPSPGSTALFTPDLVGRRSALAELDAAWAAACDRQARIVVLEGEPGIGKTRLCEEFLRALALRADGAVILRGRGREAMRDSAGAAMRELLAGLQEAPGLLSAPSGALSTLAGFIPQFRDRLPPLVRTAQGDWSLADAVARVLGDVAVERPIIVFLDDFSTADRSSRELLLSVVERLPDAALMTLLTVRSGEDAGALVTFSPGSALRRIHLRALDAVDVERLVGSMLELPVQERRTLAQRLHAEGGGNPFYVVQLVAALVDEGLVTTDAHGVWQVRTPDAVGGLPIASGLREAVGRRIAQLGEAARTVADAAAVVAAPAAPSLLREVTGLDVPEIEVALEDLVGRRLLRAQRDGTYEFAHDVVRRVVYQGLAPQRRRALHRAVVDVLSRGSGRDDATRAALAYHRGRSGRWVDRWSRLPVRYRRTLGVTAVVAMLAGVGLVVIAARDSAPPIVAIGMVRSYIEPDSGHLARPIPDMLSTNLARLPQLNVLSNARMYQVLSQLGQGQDAAAASVRAARVAGAQELIEVSLYRERSGMLRLDLQRIHTETGKVVGAYSVWGGDPFELVDSATARLAAGFGVAAGPLRVADVTTPSLVAYRLYEEGLRALVQDDRPAAYRLFLAALAEDSTFAMAAFYAQRSMLESDAARRVLQVRAAALAHHASERDRLMILGSQELSQPFRGFVLQESLVTRFPAEPHGHLALGRALWWRGESARAIPHLVRVLEMDSLGPRAQHGPCLACEALGVLASALVSLDSVDAAERQIRRLLAAQPRRSEAWAVLAIVLSYQGRLDEASFAARMIDSLLPGQSHSNVLPVEFALHRGDFANAERLLAQQGRIAVRHVQIMAQWYRSATLRTQGRLREALAAAREARRIDDPPPGSVPPSALHEAQVLLDLGRFRQAAALFDSLQDPATPAERERGFATFAAATPFPPKTFADSAWLRAIGDSIMDVDAIHFRAWFLTHKASALAAMGDTAALATLADTIQAIGARSAFARDPRVHHYVRGLLLRQRGQHAESVEAFRAGLASPYDFTRNNLELGRALLTVGRPQEAVDVLRKGARSRPSGGGWYATITELREALGDAFAAAGQPDSAAAHYRWVLAAWADADDVVIPRREAVRARLKNLSSSN